MRKTLLLIILVIISIFLGYSLAKSSFKVPNVEKDANQETEKVKRLVLKFAIVSDSGGDNDLWASRNQDNDPLSNFNQTFGKASHLLEKDRIQIVILDNSDIYKGIPSESWELLFESLKKDVKLRFVMAHKTPFHPDSAHIMGQDAQNVKAQAENLLAILEEGQISGFFSGDMHFFAQFKTPKQAVKITTIGAVASQKNFQGPRFGIVTVYDDYSWKAEDVEIR